MEITERSAGNIRVFALMGRLDHAGAAKFQETVLPSIEAGTRSAIIDCAGTSFVASMGIRALMTPTQEIARHGGRLAIVGLNHDLQRLFEMSGLMTMFQVYPTVEDAVRDGVWP